MRNGHTNIRAAVPAGNSSLMTGQLGLDLRADFLRSGDAEQAPEAGRELKGAHAARLLSTFTFEDPHKEIDGLPQGSDECVVVKVGSVHRLRQ